MHLRSVEIQGFKTFAKKTELLFEPGVTAVVGPNGSGKSNLVDAIRWVLGERSARELRGSKMEEVVYSGGARRPASGMAEVRLVIDNSDGRLAVPFQEVEVVRRGYRSGESEFWLNGSRCRLRDVEELFASTGLTQEGYSVVAQDDVDHIIQTSAAERRALIEEAAGVRGLRHKRDEALGRIRESDVTVLRLQDLAGELGPRVEELRRQAEAARNEADLTNRLEVLRGSLLRGEWLAARQRAKRAAARVATLETAVADARSEANAASAAHANQRERLAAAHDVRLTREREVGVLRLAATEALSRVELLRERTAALESAMEGAKAQLEAAHARLESLKAELAAAAADVEAAVAPPEELAEDPALDAAVEALSSATATREAAEARSAELTRLQRAAEDQVAQLEQRQASLESSGEDLRAELARAREELAQLEGAGPGAGAAEDVARAAAGRFAQAMDRLALEERLLEEMLADERAAASMVERLQERLRALRSLAADGDLPAPSAARLVELLERPGVRAAAISAGIAAATLDAWVAEGRSEGRAISRALDECRRDLEEARATLASTTGRLDSQRRAVDEARAELERRRQEQLSALSEVSAAAARDSAAAQRLDIARHRAERLEAAVGERHEERERIALALGEARAAVTAQADAVVAGEPALSLAREEETRARDEVARLQRAADLRAGRRAEIVARHEALVALRTRLDGQVALQLAEVGRARARLDELGAARGRLGDQLSEALAQHTEAAAALESAPTEGVSVQEIEELSQELLVLEKENMERRVALAHEEDALAAAREAVHLEDAAVAELGARMGAAGEGELTEEPDWEKTQREIARLERQIAHLGPVNPLAIEEYERDRERFEAIDGQLDDLVRAREGLVKIAEDLTGEIDRRFEAVFGAVAFNFQETFATLFVNGKATLRLDDPQADEPGVEILAQPAGKRMRGIRLLSGGERALTALAFILALEKVNPSPFYIFDEVDAPLDDANVRRFNSMLQAMAPENQFILITHNHQTMTGAGALYGVTLEDSGVSRVVSVRLREGEVVAMPQARTS